MIQNVFNVFDNRGDGMIEAKYIGEIVRALGLTPTESEIRKCGFQTDPSLFPVSVFFICADSRINFETFIPIYQTLSKDQKTLREDEFIEGFRVFDKDANGFITAAELRHLLTALGEGLRDDQVDELLAGLENGQGLVSYDSFVKRIMN
ncbi:myosin, light chain 1, alkali [Cichlidogyrus casuarinus]|uniref:Myosin, light chain 1, alkali n=1 Tax=Cichlidogyrus casuarinus TaxID=1844966 RepID=A0ABD2QHV8_9PLAT